MQFPIIIGLRRSCFLRAVLLSVALLGCLGLLAYPGSGGLCLGLIALTVLLSMHALSQLNPPASILRLNGDGSIAIPIDGGDWESLKILPPLTLHPLLIAFRTEDAGITRRWLLSRDSMDKAPFRRLQVFLRWRFTAAQPDVSA